MSDGDVPNPTPRKQGRPRFQRLCAAVRGDLSSEKSVSSGWCRVMWAIPVTTVLLALALPTTAAAQAPLPAPYALQPLAGDLFTAPAVLHSEFDGDYVRVAYVPAADSDRAAEALIQSTPAPPQQELTFEANGRQLKYLAVGDLSKPARMIVFYLHGLGDDRTQGMRDKQFGGAFARLKRLAAANDAIYISPDFSGFGRGAEGQIAALIADHAGRSPGAPVFVACLSVGGRLCWRLAGNAGGSSPLRGILLLSASVDRSFVEHVASSRVQIYLGIGAKDAIFSWKSQLAFFRDVKAAVPGYPIRLTIFDGGEHAAALRLTDWVGVLNWMLAGADARGGGTSTGAAAEPPCPRPRPEPGADPGPIKPTC
jgi:hypothetical protein